MHNKIKTQTNVKKLIKPEPEPKQNKVKLDERTFDFSVECEQNVNNEPNETQTEHDNRVNKIKEEIIKMAKNDNKIYIDERNTKNTENTKIYNEQLVKYNASLRLKENKKSPNNEIKLSREIEIIVNNIENLTTTVERVLKSYKEADIENSIFNYSIHVTKCCIPKKLSINVKLYGNFEDFKIKVNNFLKTKNGKIIENFGKYNKIKIAQ